MSDPLDDYDSGELDPPAEAEIDAVVGGSDDALYPMHNSILPAAPELIPAAEAEAAA